jgi:ADP-ribose pyrophosphatase YjhB (NUDIX family)
MSIEPLKTDNAQKDYPKPSYTADILLFSMFNHDTGDYRKLPEKKLSIALCKRHQKPERGKWGLPGGFLNPDRDDTILDTAKRELSHDVGLSDIYLKELRTWSKMHRDPRGRVISSSFLAITSSDLLFDDHYENPRDYEKVKWFEIGIEKINSKLKKKTDEEIIYSEDYSVNLKSENKTIYNVVRKTTSKHIALTNYEYETIESTEIAFDHVQMILDAFLFLKKNIEGSEIAFNFLPKLFTLTETKQIYDVILGTELTQANFRRKLTDKYGMVQETDLSTLSRRYSQSDITKLEGAYEAFKTTAPKGLWQEYTNASFELAKAYLLSNNKDKTDKLMTEIQDFLTEHKQESYIKKLEKKISSIDLSLVDTKKQAGHRSSRYFIYDPTWDMPAELNE